MKITIMLFEQADLLDFGGPYEVFLTASRLAVRDGLPEPFDVTTVSLNGQSITAYGGMQIVPQRSLEQAGHCDLLIVPGGIDVAKFLADKPLLNSIAKIAHNPDTVIASVCTGAFILAEAGLLDTLPWTTHWEDIDDLAGILGDKGARRQVHWVDSGNIVTGAGLSSGIAMSLHLVERFASLDLAERTAVQIGYPWRSDPHMTAY
ncbi:MAG: DJ-1/PfpI family protein [Granulosicoccus sp.]